MILQHSWSATVGRSILACSAWGLLVVVASSAVNNAAAQVSPVDDATAADTPEALQAERDKWQAETIRFYGEAKFAEAIRAAENMLAIERRWLGEDHPDVIGSIEFLAEVWGTLENWAAAEARWSEAIAWREKNIGVDHWETMDARLALENVRLLQSLDAAQRASLREARAANNEFIRLYGEGRYADALAPAAEALAINIEAFGDKHPDVATLLNNLGVLHNSLGDMAAARQYHERSLAIRREVLNDAHPDLAESLSNMGVLLQVMGDFAAARPYVKQALTIRKKTFGEDHQSAEAQAAGSDLRARIWEPLELAIGDAKTLLVSPDGTFGRLPFAALPGKSPDTFLIEDYRIALVPVPRLIPALFGKKGDWPIEKEFLLLGGVDYDQRDAASRPEHPAADLVAIGRSRGAARATAGVQRWDALPGAGVETAAIGALYHELGGLSDEALVDLRGTAATEENFRAQARRCRRLHLATHGFFAAEDKQSALAGELDAGAGGDLMRDRFELAPGFNPGLLSGLVLAGANNPPDLPSDAADFASLPEDGILMAEEVAFLPLGGVELVVLSACETGLGKTAGGEGLLGIQRAFQVAGARSTVATLWKVSDSATQRLMTMFYRNALQAKQSNLDALRNAQLELLRELRDPEAGERLAVDLLRGADAPADGAAAARGAPYFWAAFTLSGDWR